MEPFQPHRIEPFQTHRIEPFQPHRIGMLSFMQVQSIAQNIAIQEGNILHKYILQDFSKVVQSEHDNYSGGHILCPTNAVCTP